MEKQFKFCQSCGMPLKNDPTGGGKNTDGSISTKYCGYCYQDGKFTYQGNVKDFQEFCRKKMIEGGHNRIMSWLFTRNMSRLERWKS